MINLFTHSGTICQIKFEALHEQTYPNLDKKCIYIDKDKICFLKETKKQRKWIITIMIINIRKEKKIRSKSCPSELFF